ncbi:DedA family protein [Gryllotalpicola protaetiae]|uniref:DedA family protein n=1 Tax=Gryllotalpicola protaetiae TaxID=2419771 RepID=A0A387BL63_9MICO|nr:VTT domain-containing protein [Gryllotalpicola protaetiae]AYG03398.1 DedA family protein [Gryllotalpicola protaetiae]
MLASIPLLDPSGILTSLGSWALLGIGVLVFIESGVLFPFLPGDSLLITAAILAPQLGIQIWSMVVVAAIAAFLGDQVGYWLGKRLGRGLFKPDARVLKSAHLHRAEAFFARYGGASLVLGRFVPVVRTYVPLAAGVAGLRYRRFLAWNALGGGLWSALMVALGVLLGGIPFVTTNIDVLMVLVVVISVAPIALSALRARRKVAAER